MAARHKFVGAVVLAALVSAKYNNEKPQETGPAPTPPAAVAVSTVAKQAVDHALAQKGDPYIWGDEGPDSFDCSGLMQWAYGHVGIELNRVSRDQYRNGAHIPLQEAQPGDLLFWAYDASDPDSIHHVAMYLGDNQIVEAPGRGLKVRVRQVHFNEDELVQTATRPTA